MDVHDIVKKYLKENGYDGLLHEDRGCACSLNDLAPCGEMEQTCMPGYKGPCQCGEGCDFDIYGNRPDNQRHSPDGEGQSG